MQTVNSKLMRVESSTQSVGDSGVDPPAATAAQRVRGSGQRYHISGSFCISIDGHRVLQRQEMDALSGVVSGESLPYLTTMWYTGHKIAGMSGLEFGTYWFRVEHSAATPHDPTCYVIITGLSLGHNKPCVQFRAVYEQKLRATPCTCQYVPYVSNTCEYVLHTEAAADMEEKVNEVEEDAALVSYKERLTVEENFLPRRKIYSTL
ncbi:hypothetical protein Bbelb_194580 [Branchiostoma belcheri]|nr:hypothetical protein Bbelb_194580 [Branchiostoma belcheri]